MLPHLGRLGGKRDVLQCRAQISDSDSWGLVPNKSSALLRKDRDFQDGDPSELVTLCDSTSHLPVVTWFGLRHSLLWLSKGLP